MDNSTTIHQHIRGKLIWAAFELLELNVPYLYHDVAMESGKYRPAARYICRTINRHCQLIEDLLKFAERIRAESHSKDSPQVAKVLKHVEKSLRRMRQWANTLEHWKGASEQQVEKWVGSAVGTLREIRQQTEKVVRDLNLPPPEQRFPDFPPGSPASGKK